MAGRKRGWKKNLLIGGIGCLSLLGIAGVLVGLALLQAGLAVNRLGEPTAESTLRTIPVHAIGSSAAALPQGEPAGPIPGLRLDIELLEGKFEIRPGPPGSQVRVEGTYSREYYDLVEEQSSGGEFGQEVSIRLVPKTGFFARILAGLTHFNKDHPNQLTVHIPEGVPTALNLSLRAGETEAELGGLLLTDLETDMAQGNHRLSFHRPLAAELPSMRLRLEQGDMRIDDLGNARAQELTSISRMGNFQIDMDGAWRPGETSSVTWRHSMGHLEVRIPEEIRVSPESRSMVMFGGTSGRLRSRSGGGETDPDLPVLDLKLNTRFGDSQIRR